MKTITDKAIKCLLKDSTSDRPTLIYLVFRYDNKRFITSTEQSVTPYLWNAKRQRVYDDSKTVKNKQEREANATINAHLDRQSAALLKVLNQLSLAGVPFDNGTIKERLDNELGRVKKEKLLINPPRLFNTSNSL